MEESRVLVACRPPALEAAATRVGGFPVAPVGTAWPACDWCGEAMQFVMQLRVADVAPVHPALGAGDGLLLVWKCGGAIAGCEPGRARGGANHIDLLPLVDLALLVPPARTRRPPAPYALRRCYGLAAAGPGQPVEPVLRIVRTFHRIAPPPPLDCLACKRALVPLFQLDHAADDDDFDDHVVSGAVHCPGCWDTAWFSRGRLRAV